MPILVGSERVGTIELARAEPLADGERFLVETVGREIGLALETARLLEREPPPARAAERPASRRPVW